MFVRPNTEQFPTNSQWHPYNTREGNILRNQAHALRTRTWHLARSYL